VKWPDSGSYVLLSVGTLGSVLYWLKTNALRCALGFVFIVMGMDTVRQALRPGPLSIGYAHGHRKTIVNPRWYQRALWLCVGLVFLTGGLLFVILPVYN